MSDDRFVAWIVRKPRGFNPTKPTDVPPECVLVSPLEPEPEELEQAAGRAMGFNDGELASPFGAWAVVRRPGTGYVKGTPVRPAKDAPHRLVVE